MYKVLIVDDEIMIRRGLSRIIRWNEIGFEVAGAVGNAKEAQAVLESQTVDVLLTDISMPEMTGLELIRRARELQPEIKTVVISGYSEFDYAVEAIKLKVETYILKPLDPEKITEIFVNLQKTLDEERKEQKRAQYLRSEYEMRYGADSEGKGCHGEYQTKLIRMMEEGRSRELETMADEIFQVLDADGTEVDFCLKVLRNAVLYFHMKNPPYFRIYRIEKKDMNDRELLKSCFREDLRLLFACVRENAESTSILVSRQAMRQIEERYQDKELSLKKVAVSLGVSYGYLSTVFAKTYGENFKSCLMAVRVEKARELLMERKYKIYEIAEMSGYGSSRYFTDAFKRRYGISPVDYLNRLTGDAEGNTGENSAGESGTGESGIGENSAGESRL